ncbi:hypothetical protein MPER_01609 [Moniliophthora perniciosa FA553]|nr:hypothetical protein MPER_01609 [Moniliophthora perniciosa FA553]
MDTRVAGPYTKLPAFSFSGTCMALAQNPVEKDYWMKLSLSVLYP